MSKQEEIIEQVQEAAEYAAKIADVVWFQDRGLDLGSGGFLPYSHMLIAIASATFAVPFLWWVVRVIILNTWVEDHEIVEDAEPTSSSSSPASSRKRSPSISPKKSPKVASTKSMKSKSPARSMKKKSPARSKTPTSMKSMKSMKKKN